MRKQLLLIIVICIALFGISGCKNRGATQEVNESEVENIEFTSKDYDKPYTTAAETSRALIDLTNEYSDEINYSPWEKYDEEENPQTYEALKKELGNQVQIILDNSEEELACSYEEICSYIIESRGYGINDLVSLLDADKYGEGINYIVQNICSYYPGCLQCWIVNIYPDLYTKGIPEYIEYLKTETKTRATHMLENAKEQFKEDTDIPEDMLALLNSADAEISQLPDETQKSTSQNTYEHKCIVDGCSKEGTRSLTGFSGQLEYYCEEHYQSIQDTLGDMESDVGSGSASEHKCQAGGCSKEGTHDVGGEWYCTEHYNEMIEIVENMYDDVYGED